MHHQKCVGLVNPRPRPRHGRNGPSKAPLPKGIPLQLLICTPFHYLPVDLQLRNVLVCARFIPVRMWTQSITFIDGLMTPPTSPTRSAAALHPLLVYDPSGRVLCDVSCDVSSIRLRPGVALTVLDEYASNPAATRMFINIPGSPWTFDITNARGVTIRDVLSMICETMNYNVGNTEFQAFDQTIRNIASTSFQQRGGSNAGFKSGLRRFDFMGNNKFFVGLRKARDGFSWDANFALLA
jgi:hypothetical protein